MPKDNTQKGSKKKGSGSARETTSWRQNVAASLRIMEKTEPGTNSILLQAAGSLLGFVADTATSFFSNSETSLVKQKKTNQKKVTPQFDTEADSRRLNKALTEIKSHINSLLEQKKDIDELEKVLKTQSQALDEEKEVERLSLLEEVDDLMVQQVKLLPENTREHSARRVDLFFLLMVAIYNRNLEMCDTREKTIKQHGKGSRKTGTAACHASLFPNPMAKSGTVTKPNSTLSSAARSYAYSFFQSNLSTEKAVVSSEDYESLLTGTHLEDSFNLTDELPWIVNRFDCHLEGTWIPSNAVQECRAILNRVSKGEINPIQGLNEFGKVMHLFFNHMEYKYVMPEPYYTKSGQNPYPKALAQVWEYQREGTFRVFDKSVKNDSVQVIVDYKYVCMMLGLDWKDYASSFLTSSWVNSRVLELQSEIYANHDTPKL
jgi:hypothetical protein